MPFQKGREKTGGRKKGVGNARVEELRRKAQELGVDPFVILLLIAKADWKALGYDSPTKVQMTPKGEAIDVERIDVSDRRAAAADACPYIYQKLKQLEITVDEEAGASPIQVVLTIPDNGRSVR